MGYLKIRKAQYFFVCALVVILFLKLTPASAQETSNAETNISETKLNVNFQPLFLFNGAVKFDAEIRPRNKKLGAVAGAEFYGGKTEQLYVKFNESGERFDGSVKGYGINVGLVYYFKDVSPSASFYLSPGFTYRNLELTSNAPDYYTYLENNVEYISYGVILKAYTVKPQLFYGNIGFRYVASHIALDIYAGMAYKTVNNLPQFAERSVYERSTYGYTYTGFLLLGGVKIGYQF